MNELLKRTLTALVLVTAAYFLISYTPDRIFALILYFVILGGASELIRLTSPKRGSLVLAGLNGAVIGASFVFDFLSMSEAVSAVVLITGTYFLFAIRKKEYLESFVRDMGIQFLSALYFFFPLFYLFMLKAKGPGYLFFLIGVIAIGDSGAYFIGSKIGRTKIYPVASPNKSLEGIIAAVLTAAPTGLLSVIVFPIDAPATWAVMLTAGIIGLFSQLSDPIESLFKRAAGQKDSGNLLPGHGGILDRMDSYIFCAPVLYYLTEYIW